VASGSMRPPARAPTGIIALVCLSVVAAAGAAPRMAAAQPRAPAPADPELGREELSLDQLLNPSIWVATKSELHAAQTPAVVTVVSADEIQARGYTSLADVLRSVPGFYDVYDGVTHNVGIRGVNGGQNASGSGLKLMIDGQPVDYRPNSGNFFGEELIPMELVERVEIIRGPASALYGADAFLGAINVVTRSADALPGARLVGQGAAVRQHLGGGGGLVMAGKGGPVEVVLGASYLFLNRTGLDLPPSSPLLPNAAVSARAPSRGDFSRPATALLKVSLSNVLSGTLTLLASWQRLDSHGEYQYFGPLDHRTRVTALNQNYRLTYDLVPSDSVTLTLSAHHFFAAPTEAARLGIGRDDYLMLPALEASGDGASAEIRFTPYRILTLTADADVLFEDSTTETYDQKLLQPVLAPDGSVLRAAGTITPGEGHGEIRDFRNLGAMLQAMVTPTERWTGIAGLRLDDHNIYGVQLSARGGLVHSYKAVSIKLLYGSSFKAPSAEQLYARPIAFGGVLGNPNLKAQTAQSVELALGLMWPNDLGDLQVNGFVTNLQGRVEFLPTGSYVIANNIQNERLVGGELVSHLVPWKRLRWSVLGSVARTVSRSGSAEGLLGKPDVSNPLFPRYQIGTIVDGSLPWARLHLSTELAYVGPRPASFSNSVLEGRAYNLAPYVYSAASVSMAGPLILPERSTRVALRVTDLLDQRWSEPGFGGIDVPTQGITAILTIAQGF
jgi:outer membrane receptor protein involved in Fe transport